MIFKFDSLKHRYGLRMFFFEFTETVTIIAQKFLLIDNGSKNIGLYHIPSTFFAPNEWSVEGAQKLAPYPLGQPPFS